MITMYNLYAFIQINIPQKKGRLVGEKIRTSVNVACQGNLVCHFGHTCHRFVSPVLKAMTERTHYNYHSTRTLPNVFFMKHLQTAFNKNPGIPSDILPQTGGITGNTTGFHNHYTSLSERLRTFRTSTINCSIVTDLNLHSITIIVTHFLSAMWF
jgi:hypothetical protein